MYIRGEPARVSRLTFVALLNRAFAESTKSNVNTTENAKYKKKRLVTSFFFIYFLNFYSGLFFLLKFINILRTGAHDQKFPRPEIPQRRGSFDRFL